MSNKWTNEDIEKLKTLNNEYLTRPQIAKCLNRTGGAVGYKMNELKIYSLYMNRLLENEKKEMIKLFNEGKTIKEISKILNITLNFTYAKARKFDLISQRGKILREQNELLRQGKKRCNTCKNIFIYPSSLFHGQICKECSNKKNSIRYYELKENPTLKWVFKNRIHSISERVRKHSYAFDLTEDYLIDLYNKQNGLCFYTGEKMELSTKENKFKSKLISIDRIDATKGYIKDNVVLCCNVTNVMKRQLNIKEFIDLCEKIVNYYKEKQLNVDCVKIT